MPQTTLRRHLAVLVECGLIIRQDTPNGKRHARSVGEARSSRLSASMGILLAACPSMRELACGDEIRHRRDFLAAAELVRPMLGITPSAWRGACEVQGEQQAAITLAAIYQRADQINSAGGYLRCLTDRAGDGKFSAWPMILASLLRPNSMPKRRPRRPMGRRMMAIGGKGGSRVSETLVPSLRRNHDAGSM
ncbi:replication initiation protein RepC [Mesorhizobium sp. AR07]|uniref:replication initiation protein RepC n=1 Tax=Mesorhizobium sp. AR07 TaxID=2865838 RepID=UPI00215E0465|nr:replication initiation protein RepC [Mesorhizobium sp. AR07]